MLPLRRRSMIYKSVRSTTRQDGFSVFAVSVGKKRLFHAMASKDNSQAHQSENTSEDKIILSEDKIKKILETLPELNKLLSSLKENPLERSKEEVGITVKNNQKIIIGRSLSAHPAMPRVSSDDRMIMRLQHHFQLLKYNLGKLERFQANVGVELDNHLATLQSLITNWDRSRGFSQTTTFWIKPDLEGIEKKISDFLYEVLLSGKSEKHKATAYGDQDDEDKVHKDKAYYYLPGIHTNVEDIIKCEAFRQVKQKFMELKIEQKICLLSFAVFPENREVHRTMLMYWWIGEGILPVKGAEEAVREVLKDFTDKKLVEPVEDRRKVAPSSYKMTPFVHSSIIHLSKELGLFNIYHKGKKPSTSMSEMGKVCLVEGSSTKAALENMSSLDVETGFNVSERDLDSTVKFFSKNPHKFRRFMINSSEAWFKALNVFYLGRWERTKKRHIQVKNHELMKCLKHVTKVKVLSLQGISAIRSLSSSVCKLHQLIVLDLRECYELTKLPEKIDSLQNLVCLDMTGCYMLEWIPLRLALLKNLEVLKGFVVSDAAYENVACKLHYLKHLQKLRKLSIEINRDDFDLQQLLEGLVDLKGLTSLKVTWRRDLTEIEIPSVLMKVTGPRAGTLMRAKSRIFSKHKVVVNELPSQLENLSLQRFPDKEFPTWLHPENLLHLKKLHIGGARELKGFDYDPWEPTKSTVEVLRLTSLPKLSVGWIELKELCFPNLTFLEKYECPKVSLTPCDGNGIWRADQDCSTILE